MSSSAITPSIIKREMCRLLAEQDINRVDMLYGEDHINAICRIRFRYNGKDVATKFFPEDLRMSLGDFSDRFLMPVASMMQFVSPEAVAAMVSEDT